jgi:catechol 2,3-dioxygenase-like lactoylglutathione lyase family enzyme
MLSQNTPVATLATADMPRARRFYEDTLGLTPGREETDGVFYDCGAGAIFVYRSAFAGTNKATAVTFGVPPETFDAEIEQLRGKGVTFMTFDLEGVAWKDGIASIGESLRAAWFADPDGNIINVSTGTM